MKNILLLFTLLFLSCSDNITPEPPEPTGPTLPAITTEGLNTFGCLVNGEVWLPEGGQGPFNFNPEAKYDESSNGLQLSANKSDTQGNIQDIMHITISPSVLGEYEFSYILSWTYASFINNTDCRYYYLDTTRYNVVNISKLDQVNDIISGTFDFKVIHSECMDTLHFSDGRFDINYHL